MILFIYIQFHDERYARPEMRGCVGSGELQPQNWSLKIKCNL